MSHSNVVVTEQTEEDLIQKARLALSQCRWTIGECASQWTRRFAKGRTDADFGNLVGLSGDQIYQRRRVWDTFSDVRDQFPSLKWSHFYLALNWDDASDCLQWAEETQSTTAEMRAWRRAQRGEDLMVDADEFDAPITFVSGELSFVQDPGSFSAPGENLQRRVDGNELAQPDNDAARVAALAREVNPNGDLYAPFHSGAIQPPPPDSEEKPRTVETISPEQLAKRLCATIERCNKAINDEMLAQFGSLQPKLVKRLMVAVEELHSKVKDLKTIR